MEILILDTTFKAIAILDTLESLIWTDRYCEFGDFEIYTLVSDLNVLQEDYYLCLTGSDHVMIIESLQIKCDTENGNRLIVTGRSLESILNRRIIWDQTVITGNLQNGIQTLLNDSIISPTIADRTISNFIFEASTDPIITALTVNAQFNKKENLYEAIQKLCVANHIGFKVTLSGTNQFVFKLYAGVDRSYDQITNSYVVFSPNFENIINSDYLESKKMLKNVIVIDGEGEGSTRKQAIVGSGSDLSRRELYADASYISQTVDEVPLTDEEYIAQLAQKGSEILTDYIFEKAFDGQADTFSLFKYGDDFFLGDLVQITNEYGMEAKTRVIEIIRSQNVSGLDIYPTFAMDE